MNLSFLGPDRVAAPPDTAGHAPAEDWRAGGFGIYVHWPFCAAKCPYCDFNSHVRAGIDQDRWRDALVRELRAAARDTRGRAVGSIFFGGGTPSLMPAETVGAVIDTIAAEWHLAPEAEITLEANPTSVEAERFRGYRAAGVNRLSMGIQALNDRDLKALGRLHSLSEALAAFDIARATFERVSFDLIYARQGQDLDDWRRELGLALGLAADHLSLYQLTIEDGTRFGELARRGRLRGLPDETLAADLYFATQELCEAAGLPAYETSNHAAAGAEGRHNLVYWRSGDYVGIGPGAHGRLTLDGTRWATETPLAPEAWLTAVESGAGGISMREPVSSTDRAVELLLMGLRLEEGIDPRRFRALGGQPLDAKALEELRAEGLLSVAPDRIKVTAAGRPVLNAILENLFLTIG
ncbi:radical SAM family heme chaperone HemW [Amaricoccus solimangrovi]|uniref:Heme chaperone HemW n=1 Tax=Amaricoccus solimangrovi TaxID=2589815 RepID=A0A501X0R9_9RHOB|nr:radical SAM family heme chaperone HemW [Amaricoccus solimangrovi]TPE52556.1 coproporphyrinogen III oxidase [Amaricoccus solimangrovi]